MIPTLRLFSRTTYRGAAGSGPGRSGITAARSSPDSRKSPRGTDAASSFNWFKRAQRGLYDGAQLQSGNNVPESRQKTKRLFKPNVQRKALWSNLLNKMVRLKVTTRGLKSIEKKGGLDYYIAGTSDWKLGELGRRLRSEMGERISMLQGGSQLMKPTSGDVASGQQQERQRSPAASGSTGSSIRAESEAESTAQALEGLDTGGVRAAHASAT